MCCIWYHLCPTAFTSCDSLVELWVDGRLLYRDPAILPHPSPSSCWAIYHGCCTLGMSREKCASYTAFLLSGVIENMIRGDGSRKLSVPDAV